MFEDLSSLHSAETQLSDKHWFFLLCVWKQSGLGRSFPAGQLVGCSTDGCLTFPVSCLSSLGSGGALQVRGLQLQGLQWVLRAHLIFSFFFFDLWEGEGKTYRLDLSLAHGRNFRDEDVVAAHCFLYVTSTLVRCMGPFWKPSVIVSSANLSETTSQLPKSLGCFEDAALGGSSTSGNCAANQQTHEISLSSGCACNGLGLQLFSR